MRNDPKLIEEFLSKNTWGNRGWMVEGDDPLLILLPPTPEELVAAESEATTPPDPLASGRKTRCPCGKSWSSGHWGTYGWHGLMWMECSCPYEEWTLD